MLTKKDVQGCYLTYGFINLFDEKILSFYESLPPFFARFCRGGFDKNYKATIGVDFEMERFEVLGVPFSLQL